MKISKGPVLALVSGVALFAVAVWMFLQAGGFLLAFLPVKMPIDGKAEYARAAERLANAHDRYGRWCHIADAAFWSVDAGDLERAARLADEALAMAPEYRGDWNYGNVLHKAQLTKGRIMLRSGSPAAAASFLREAGKTPGSPQLNTFGPNMMLAQELLRAGEKRAVQDYLDEVESFWRMDRGALTAWRWQVGWGLEPNFGANLAS